MTATMMTVSRHDPAASLSCWAYSEGLPRILGVDLAVVVLLLLFLLVTDFLDADAVEFQSYGRDGIILGKGWIEKVVGYQVFVSTSS